MEGLTYVLGLHNAGNALQMGGVVLGGGGDLCLGAAQCRQCFTNG